MTLLILSFLSKNRLALLKSKIIHLFLILVAMLISSSASPQVVADFTTLSVNTGCGSLVVDFQDLSTGAPDAWLWDFGNGNSSTLKNPTAIYANPGLFDVILIASNSVTNDSKTSIGLIEVFNSPISEISINSPVTGCMPLMVDFKDISFTNNSIVNWQWDLGDGTILDIQNPSYQYEYAQTFDVTLAVVSADGCKHDTTIINAVEVFNNPIADFNASAFTTTEHFSEIEFYNNSTGAIMYEWDFDNGSISAERNPIVDFQNIKNHEVVLHVVSAEGCESEIMKNINIFPEYTLYAPNAFTPNGDGNNDVFLAKGNGVTSFEMQVFDRWGGIVFASSDIEYGWDGLDASANSAGVGTYMYHISLYDYNGKLWVYNGELNLMR